MTHPEGSMSCEKKRKRRQSWCLCPCISLHHKIHGRPLSKFKDQIWWITPLFTYNLPCVAHTIHSSLHNSNDKVLPFLDHNLHQAKYKAIQLVSFSKSGNYWLSILKGKVNIHKLSKTSVKLLNFHWLQRPWQWQVIFPKIFRHLKL